MTKKLKKTTAFLSAVAMVMAMLLYFPSGMFSNIDWGLKASAEGETQTENWINSAEAFAGGTGTEGDPYQIATAEQLAYLAQQVNTGTDYSEVFFKSQLISTLAARNGRQSEHRQIHSKANSAVTDIKSKILQ